MFIVVLVVPANVEKKSSPEYILMCVKERRKHNISKFKIFILLSNKRKHDCLSDGNKVYHEARVYIEAV